MAETLTQQLELLHTRMHALLVAQQHGQDQAFGVESRLPTYAGLDDMQEDRAEYRDIQEENSLHDRLDALQQDQQQARYQSYGMEMS